jgi:hypothetical protein
MERLAFVPSTSFRGPSPGWFFTIGRDGLGYYPYLLPTVDYIFSMSNYDPLESAITPETLDDHVPTTYPATLERSDMPGPHESYTEQPIHYTTAPPPRSPSAGSPISPVLAANWTAYPQAPTTLLVSSTAFLGILLYCGTEILAHQPPKSCVTQSSIRLGSLTAFKAT